MRPCLRGLDPAPAAVRLSNYAAQQFYRKIGYREVFHIDRYYANGEDAVVMMKWFRF